MYWTRARGVASFTAQESAFCTAARVASGGVTVRIVVVTGVAGTGKTTVGRALAARLGWPYAEGDSFHPPANVRAISAGLPLTDAQRWPWIERIASWIDGQLRGGQPGVVSCSALRRAYRERLTGGRAEVALVFLDGPPSLTAARLAARRGHFAGPGILDSQLASLERPAADEGAVTVDVTKSPTAIVYDIVSALGLDR
jgi:gluconokinase